MKKYRLSLDVTPKMKNLIDGLSESIGVSQSEILRRAIALFSAVKKGEADGERAAMIKDDVVVARLVGF